MGRDYDSEGENDGAQGEYNPPHSISNLDRAIYDDHAIDKMQEHNDQHGSGHDKQPSKSRE
jgi:hypothetical protein